jgi:hypothetical protein
MTQVSAGGEFDTVDDGAAPAFGDADAGPVRFGVRRARSWHLNSGDELGELADVVHRGVEFVGADLEAGQNVAGFAGDGGR